MNKTLTVNLNGMVFHIDEDAYEMLGGYLADVRKHFSSEESPEIMNDIEARIAELFTERMRDGRNVVNSADVEAVIAVLANPTNLATAMPRQRKPGSRAAHRAARCAVSTATPRVRSSAEWLRDLPHTSTGT